MRKIEIWRKKRDIPVWDAIVNARGGRMQQFDSLNDGETATDDDLRLGRVPVAWSVEEYSATFDDDIGKARDRIRHVLDNLNQEKLPGIE